MSRHGENIYKRRDDRWEGRLKIGINIMGKSIYKSIYAESYAECKEKLKFFPVADVPIVAGQPDRLLFSFSELSAQWLMQIKPTVKISTFGVYYYIVNKYVDVYFNQCSINDVSENMVNLFVSLQLKRGLTARTIHLMIVVLKGVFVLAERKFHVINPIKNIKMPKQKAKNDMALSDLEWNKLIRELDIRHDDTAIAVAISLYTGMRIGELCALKKSDINFSENIIYVERTVQRVKNIEEAAKFKTKILLSVPKSDSSMRQIPIPNILLKKLELLCKNRENDQFLLGILGRSALDPRTLQYRFKRFLEEIGMKEINFHTLRHTFATKCIEKNVDIKTLSEILGHSNVRITLERYVHSSLEFKRKQINRLSEAM